MRLNHFKSILIFIIFLSPIFSLAVHAQTEDKAVTITDNRNPASIEKAALYSGTYVYQGTRSSGGDGPVQVRPYYKNGDYYLFADYMSETGNTYPYQFGWFITNNSNLKADPDGIAYTGAHLPYDSDMNYPEECNWWGDATGVDVTVEIVNASSGVPPTVATLAASLVMTTSGTMVGNVTADGGAVTDRGFVYSSTDTEPEIDDPGVTQITSGTGTGNYSEVVYGLTAGVTYYYQAYGHNEHGTTYGGVKSFTTPTTSAPNKLVSGIENDVAANGVYIWIGTYYGKPAWKHETLNYWVYYSILGTYNQTEYEWYIDNQLRNEHGDGLYYFYHDDAATCPSSGWASGGGRGEGTGTPLVVDYPQIDFTDGSAYSPGNPTGGTNNNPIGRFFLDPDADGASLTAATITVTGTRTNVSNLKLWSSTDATFNSGSDTQLNSQSDGASVAFSGFSSPISSSGTYYFITADLASSASGTIALTIGSKTNLTYSGGASSTVFTNAALSSGTLTIIPAIEMNVKGNGISIPGGDTTPIVDDGTDLGNVDVTTGSNTNTFTIESLGAGTLSLTGLLPYVTITGHTSDFTLTQTPSNSIAGGSTTTFEITFNPTAGGTRSALVSIANDDVDENPYNFDIQGTGIYTAPTTQANTVTFSNVGAAATTIGWTNGNGSNRIVFLYEGNSGNTSPVDNTSYTANSKFKTGTQIDATGWYCVYNGVGTSVNVTDLMPGTTYRVMVCEYNGTAGYEAYNTSSASENPVNQSMYSILINEVDADTPGSDAAEFIELYDGGIGNVSLDGLVIVFYNGGTDQSYYSKDLDSYSTNAYGYFVLGNTGVTGVNATFPNNILQNGADAVALYIGDAADFLNNTPITNINVVDAFVYDTDDPDDDGLLILLSSGGQVNENRRGNSENHSNQRLPNGTGGLRNTSTYDQQPPTPDAANYGYPEIVSSTYDYNTNQLVVTGKYLVSNAGENNDVDVSTLTFTGEGGGTYTLSSTSDVEISSATQFSLTLSGSDLQNVEYLLNKNGTSSAGGTTYDLAAADNWMTGAPSGSDISDLTGNGITVSNYTSPVITSSTYDVSTGILIATGTNFVINPSADDIDASLFTFTGQGGGTYTLTNTNDVEITSSTQFSLTLSSTDKLNVAGLLNKNGTQSVGGTTYNLAAADNWMTGSPAVNNIADPTTGITVSNVPPPSITSATYNYSTNALVVTGTDLIANGSGADVDVSMLTFTGQGGSTYTLSSSSDVEISSATEFSVTLSGIDLTNVEALLNKNGTQAADGVTTYNLGAAEDWLTGFDPAENIADLAGNTITVSNYANPTITSATYDASTGVLVVTGTNLVSKSGANNDINASFISITGEGDNSYSLLNTSNVEITSGTSFTLTLNATDKLNVDGLLNKSGVVSAGGQTYNIAGADDWNAGAYPAYYIQDLDNNAITVSNILTPTITNATYDSDSGVFVVTGTNLFKKYGAANDIDVSKFTITGEGGNYTISNAIADVELTSATEFSFTVTGSDKTQVDSRLDLFGTQSSGGTTYNLEAAEDWLTSADPSANIADLVGNGITVVVTPKITSATYNAATGVIVVTGTNIQANAGGPDIDASKFTITGEGGETYTLTNTPDVERSGSTQFTLTLSVTDWNAIAQIINKNGTASTSGTTYNIAAADDWCTNVTAGNTADLTGNGITASNVAVPTITSATYNVSTGVLTVTGSRLVKKSGVLNDIDVSKFTITGEGGETYSIANTANVEITSGTQFTVTLDATDKNAVNLILNKNGTSSTSATTYNLAAAEDWSVGSDAAVNVIDATGNGITVSNVAVPVITSAYYHWSNGVLTATGTGFTKKAGTANDIDASKFTFKGEGGASYTLAGSPDVEITSGTEFTITLDATDKTAINLLLNKPGMKSNDNTTYNLAAAEDWAAGADAAVNVVDATTPITAGNFNNPPTGGNDVVNMSEDSPRTFAVSDFTYNDADADLFDGIQIQTIETAGELKYNGADVTIGLDCLDVTKLVFTSASNVSASPYATFTFKVKDDRGGYSIAIYTMTINVLPVNDAPVLLGIESTAVDYQEGSSSVGVSSSITITDIDDSNIESATAAISGNYKSGEDVLSFSAPAGILGEWSVESGTVNFTGSSSIANYQSALTSVAYGNTSANPDTSDRTVSFTVNDGELSSNSLSRIVSINSVNNAPVISQISDQSMLEDSSLTIDLSASDAENNQITFSAISNKNDVQLSITESKLTVSSSLNWNGSANIIVIASDGRASDSTNFNLTVTPVNDAPVINSIADIKINEDETAEVIIEGSDVENDSLIYSALSLNVNVTTTMTGNKLTVVPQKDWVGNAEIIITANDGKLSTSLRINVEVIPINDAPVLTNIETESLEYTVKGEGLNITNSLVITDIDDLNLKSAAVSISGNYVKGEDRLLYSDQSGITGNWNSETGTMTLTGKAGLATYQSAIASVQYVNSFITPTASTRTISITVSDSQSVSNTVSRDINVTGQNTAPVLSDIETERIKFIKGDSETLITSAISVIDSDSKFLYEGSVTFSEGYIAEEDVLIFSNTSNIIGSYNESSGSLVLTGQATTEEYQSALRSVMYKNIKGVTAATSLKEITFTVRDGQLISNQLSREIEAVSPLLTPSNLTLQVQTDGSVKLTWKDNSNNEDGFAIWKVQVPQGTMLKDSVSINTTEYIDNNVIEAENYNYVVLAFNNSGSVSDITNDNQNSILVPLKAPIGLSASVDPVGKINLTWKDNSSVEDNYFVERSVITNDNFTLKSQVDKDSTHFSDTEILNNTKYFYRIYAVKDTMKSLFSNEVEVIAIITDVNDELSEIPTDYKLYANYPNPFNPTTTIKFDIPFIRRSAATTYHTKLVVYNLLGQQIVTLVNEQKAPGYYEVKFNGSELSSGMYLYRLEVGEFVQTRKLILIK